MNTKQSGNAVLWIVLGVVAIGLGVVIVWRYFAATDSLDNASQAEQSTVTKTPGAISKRTTINEWDVVLGTPASLKDEGVTVTYRQPMDSEPEVVEYRSTSLASSNNTCASPTEGRSHDQLFMTVSRAKENTEALRTQLGTDTQDVVQVGEWYYFVSAPDIRDCYATDVIDPFVSAQTRQTIVKSIRLAQ